MSRIRVIVVDDFEPFSYSLQRLLRTDIGVEVVGAGGNFNDALKLMFELRPDVALIDLTMPAASEFRCEDVKVLALETNCAVIAMSIWTDEEANDKAQSLGASGVTDKNALAQTIIPHIFEMVAGKSIKPRLDSAVS